MYNLGILSILRNSYGIKIQIIISKLNTVKETALI